MKKKHEQAMETSRRPNQRTTQKEIEFKSKGLGFESWFRHYNVFKKSLSKITRQVILLKKIELSLAAVTVTAVWRSISKEKSLGSDFVFIFL